MRTCMCLPVPACGCSCLPVLACACACLCLPVPACACLCLAVPGCAWLCLPVPGCAWLCLAVPGCAPAVNPTPDFSLVQVNRTRSEHLPYTLTQLGKCSNYHHQAIKEFMQATNKPNQKYNLILMMMMGDFG